MILIPAIDLIGGQCVRLTQGDYAQKKVYNENPLEVAKQFEGAGITRLHLVDLDGAKAKKVINLPVLELIASQTSLHIDFGGGIQSTDDLQRVLDAGAKQITAGSIAIKNPTLVEEWLTTFGPETIILGADAKNETIAVSGWAESTDVSVYSFVSEWQKKGMQYTISTDVAKDGLLQGPSLDLYKKLQMECPDMQIIASGGVSQWSDWDDLEALNLFGVIVGKAIYEGHMTLEEIEKRIIA
ncbi:MAG: 1-(5-phosphoribosyl)-5-[(5-phosphoribosylamino)methylideneamino]imidazole-4-carboxamide isomerase [Spirosomataceae bacterium]